MGFFRRLSGIGAADEIAHVARNLRFLLNTKRGVGAVLGDFGLGAYDTRVGWNDYTENYGFFDASDRTNERGLAGALAEEMQQVIARYEPRLREAKVEWRCWMDAERYGLLSLTGQLGDLSVGYEIRFYTRLRCITVESTTGRGAQGGAA